MQITNEIKEKILDSIDIVEIISETVELRKRGKNFIGLCPFHSEKTPSFTVSQDRGIFKCFGCGKSGNAITFLMDSLGLSYVEAIKDLARRANIVIPEREFSAKDKAELSRNDLILQVLNDVNDYYRKMLNTTAGKIAAQFFSKRGFSSAVINEFQLGYSPDSWDATLKELQKRGFHLELIKDAGLVVNKEDGNYYDRFRGRAMFPIHNTLGRVIAFGARQLSEEDTQAKYINSPQTHVYDKSRSLYGLFQAKNEIRNKKTAILVEGYADVITLHQAGYKNSVASSGTALTKEQLEILSKLADTLYIAYDSDEAGVKATERAIELAIGFGFDLKIVRLPGGEDPDSIIQKHGSNLFKTYLNNAVNFLDFKYEQLSKTNDLSSPYSKASAIREMLTIIRKIPDRLQHDDYISYLANLMRLTNNQIKKIYDEKNTQDKVEKRKNDSLEVSEIVKTSSNNNEKVLKLKMLKEEKILLNIFLTNTNAVKVILSNLQLTEDYFFTEDGKRLFLIIMDLYSSSSINLEKILESPNISDGDKDLLMRLAMLDDILTRETPSDNWQKFGKELPEKNIIKIVSDSIVKLQLYKIDIKLRDLKTILQTDSLNYSAIKEISRLNKKRIELLTYGIKEINKTDGI